MPFSRASARLRSSTSVYSISIVTLKFRPSGMSGLYASSSPRMPSSSKIRSMRSISWTW
jgi:hypothetical protein